MASDYNATGMDLDRVLHDVEMLRQDIENMKFHDSMLADWHELLKATREVHEAAQRKVMV